MKTRFCAGTLWAGLGFRCFMASDRRLRRRHPRPGRGPRGLSRAGGLVEDQSVGGAGTSTRVAHPSPAMSGFFK